MNAVAFDSKADTYDPAVDPTPGGQNAVTSNQAVVKDKFSIVTNTYKIDVQAGTRLRVIPTTTILTEDTMRNIRKDVFSSMGDSATELVDTMVVDMRFVDRVMNRVTNLAADTAADDRADLYFGMTNVAYVQFDGEQDTLVDDVVAATESPEFSSHVLVVDEGMTVDDFSMAFESEVEEKLHLNQADHSKEEERMS